jgi:hypothetical protein
MRVCSKNTLGCVQCCVCVVLAAADNMDRLLMLNKHHYMTAWRMPATVQQ